MIFDGLSGCLPVVPLGDGLFIGTFAIHRVIVWSDQREELRQLNDELSSIEEQLSCLLDRQQKLLAKRRLLKQAMADAAAVAPSVVQNWSGTGRCRQSATAFGTFFSN